MDKNSDGRHQDHSPLLLLNGFTSKEGEMGSQRGPEHLTFMKKVGFD
jgi:hypothetical protein